MKKLLLVDDDAVVTRAYRDRLSAHGFQVNTAASGSAAIAILRAAKPDLVVLDLMMPDLSGVEVLKFIRSEPRLAATPVVVLTNAYLNDLGRQAAMIGIQKALLKAQCSPSVLMACIDELLEPKRAPERAGANATRPHDTTRPLLRPDLRQRSPHPNAKLLLRLGPPPPRLRRPKPPTPRVQPRARSRRASLGAKASADLLAHAPTICADLRKLFQAVAQQPRNGPEQQKRLQDLYRRVHFLTAAAGLTEYAQLTQTAGVFEALLYVLMKEPARIGPSVLRTLANLVDFVELLFRHAGESVPGGPLSAQVLVVDDDPVSNRLVVSALREAQLDPRSTEDPLVAWQWANQRAF